MEKITEYPINVKQTFAESINDAEGVTDNRGHLSL